MTHPPAIFIDHVDFGYEKTRVLEDVCLTIPTGQFTGVFGPNGGGKTTFLKLLMGFLKPDRGSIALFGQSSAQFSKRIGYVPQAMHLDKAFPISVMEVVLMGCLSACPWWGRYSQKSRQQAETALKRVDLLSMADAPFGTLSGGQAQRVLIARAIAGNPHLLLLDEPTASVDLEAEKAIYHLLQELRHQMTIIMVSHDLQSIITHADTFICIHRTVTQVPAQEVCSHFSLGLYHSPKGRS